MSIGTGFFLSSVVLALVILYGITKDRWRWRRIVKRVVLACVAFSILGFAVFVIAIQIDNSDSWLRSGGKPDRKTGYAGLRLGMTQDEVVYVKGTPLTVLQNSTTAPTPDQPWLGFPLVIKTKDLVGGKTVKDYRTWSYDEREGRIDVLFNEAKSSIVDITCYASQPAASDCPSINGVRTGDFENDVLRILGAPSDSKIQDGTKTLDYRDVGITLRLTKERVYMISIGSPDSDRWSSPKLP